MIFVFGSNLAGIHGGGAAAFARKYKGAVMGKGVGLAGESYAIPTKDANIYTMPLDEIKPFVVEFLDFARKNPEMQFQVTRIGCGLAGYIDADIAPMFVGAPDNCHFDYEWERFLGERKYWGTFM